MLLSGLRDAVGDLTAVVTVADDGGSSGRLRAELGVAPPGDVRNCLVALAGRRRLAEVFNYRFEGGGDLRDHSVGNIIIAALAEMSELDFCEGVEQAGRFLRVKGRVFGRRREPDASSTTCRRVGEPRRVDRASCRRGRLGGHDRAARSRRPCSR